MEEKVTTGVIKNQQVRFQGAGHEAAAGSAHLPKVQCREEGGVVKSIEVVCPCGSKIVIDCDYSKGEGA